MTTISIIGIIIGQIMVFAGLVLMLKQGRKKQGKYSLDYPVAFHTVDIAIVRIEKSSEKLQVLLVQKPHEVESGFWRFPGGFIDPSDDSAEDAAIRESKEETGMVLDARLDYIGTAKIDDPRYRESDHKIITSFYLAKYLAGEAGEGFDDIKNTKWFYLPELDSRTIKNPTHAKLFDLFQVYANRNSDRIMDELKSPIFNANSKYTYFN